MNKDQKDFELFRLRSTGAIIRDGYRLYLDCFRRIFRATWLVALVYALTAGILTTVFINTFPQTVIHILQLMHQGQGSMPRMASHSVFLLNLVVYALLMGAGLSVLGAHRQTGTIPVAQHWYGFWERKTMLRTLVSMVMVWLLMVIYIIVAVLVIYAVRTHLSQIALGLLGLLFFLVAFLCLPSVVMCLLDYILNHQRKGPFSGRFSLRYWGNVFIITLVVTIVSFLLVMITQLPANVLMIANMRSQAGTLMGDPTGMPDYMSGLNLVIFTLAGFIQAYVILSSFFPFYYLYGSVQAQEQERADMKMKMDSQQDQQSLTNHDYIEYK